MGRAHRIECPGGLWHVWSRGVDRMPIHLDDVDHTAATLALALAVERFRWQVLAYCFMTNHFHFLFATPEPNLARGMHLVKSRIARDFNRRHPRTGPVFEKRYESKLLLRDGHLLELCRYLVLNPERARLVDHPADWAWSSYRVTATADLTTFVAVDELLRLFGEHDLQRAAARYRVFVAEGCGRAHLR